jgi:hypothetical protein
MELRVHLYPFGDDSLELIASLIPEGKREIISARWSVALDDPILRDILFGGESTKGFWVSAETRLSAAELRESSHFEIVCRKIIRASDKDYEANEAALERAPLMDKGGVSPIRLASGFTLTRIPLKPHMVSAITDQAAEYLVGSAVADVFTSNEFSGFSFNPINNPRIDAPHEGFFQIFSDSVLEPVEVDCSVECIQSDFPAENGKFRHLGCLTYREDNLAEIPDFSRTAEPWEGWGGCPSWVVSSRVVSTFRESKLRGWAFRPVLVKESELYSSYLSQWTQLNKLVAQLSRSMFDGGRW